VWRLVLRGKDQSNIEAGTGVGGRDQLLPGEILDAYHLDGTLHVAEIRPRQFIARWPSRENSRARIVHLDESFRSLMHANVVCVSPIVLWRKTVRRIDNADFQNLNRRQIVETQTSITSGTIGSM
jgi:hypothetical protein